MLVDPEPIAPYSLALKGKGGQSAAGCQLLDADGLGRRSSFLFAIILIITSSVDATGSLPTHLFLFSMIKTPGTSGKESDLP